MTVLVCPSNSGTKHPADSSTQSLVTQPLAWHAYAVGTDWLGSQPARCAASCGACRRAQPCALGPGLSNCSSALGAVKGRILDKARIRKDARRCARQLRGTAYAASMQQANPAGPAGPGCLQQHDCSADAADKQM